MAAYEVTYKLRANLDGLTAREKEESAPDVVRVSAISATRALSQVANNLKDDQIISTKNEVIFLEARVVG